MKKRKKSSIVSRVTGGSSLPKEGVRTKHSGSRPRHRKRTSPAATAISGSSQERRSRDGGRMVAASDILRQAAYAVGRLVDADQTGKHGVSLKSLTLGRHVKQKKAVYAVTVETLKYYTILEDLARSVGILCGKDGMSMATCCVLVKEVVLGSGLSRVGPAEKMILIQENALKKNLNALMKERGVDDPTGLLSENALARAARQRRRTVRVNTLKMSIEDVYGALEKEFGNVVQNEHIAEVLELDPGTDLHSHNLVRHGNVVLQSLASCIPAFVLNPEYNWNVIDACAAPGNKTTHIAAIMAKKAPDQGKVGHVVAFDKDHKRLQRLEHNVILTGAGSIIQPRCEDFLKTNPQEHAHVDAILLDPSCSGSGTSVSRMDYLLPSSSTVPEKGVMHTDVRVKQLREFQVSALQHALDFPNVKRVVYSTCSIFHEENEGVVAHVLPYAQDRGFGLTSCLDGWKRRGISMDQGLSPQDACNVVRIDPLEDGTDGFFVAMFERFLENE